MSNLLRTGLFWSKWEDILRGKDQGETHYSLHYRRKCEEEKCGAAAAQRASASAFRPGPLWAARPKPVPDVWGRDVTTAAAVTGTAVRFPLQ